MISEKMKVIVHYIKNELDNKMKKYNITATQLLILELLYIKRDEEVIQKDVCNHLKLQHSTVINILRRLEVKKLITKETKHTSVLKITDEGINLLNKIGFKTGFVENKLLDGFTDEEKETLSKQLDKMYENIKEKL